MWEDFSIISEDVTYTWTVPFADVWKTNWFAHYADYAFKKWLTEWLHTSKNGLMELSPRKQMTRYEATKAIVIAYEKIVWKPISMQSATASKITDVPNTNPYYNYVRKAELAWLVGWYPQKDGTFVFRWDANLTRAEFAKIITMAFNEYLINVDDVVQTSDAYVSIIKAIQATKSDKLTFVKVLFAELEKLSDDAFLKKFKVRKDIFLEVLSEKVLMPMTQPQ